MDKMLISQIALFFFFSFSFVCYMVELKFGPRYCRMWLMKVSSLVQAKTRKDSSCNLIRVSTLSASDTLLLFKSRDICS